MFGRIATSTKAEHEAAGCDGGDGGDRFCNECGVALRDIEHERPNVQCWIRCERSGGER